MPTESYSLIFKRQSAKAIGVSLDGEKEMIWLPKSVLDKVPDNALDYEALVPDEQIDVYVPDWIATDKGLL